MCDGGEYNMPECGFDFGECIEFNKKYRNWTISYPFVIGDSYVYPGSFKPIELETYKYDLTH